MDKLQAMSATARILIGLVAGLLLGVALAAIDPPWRGAVTSGLDAVGGVWLDALRMTIIPLVFALLVTGVAQAAGALEAGGVAGRALILFGVLLVASAALGAVVADLILQAWPVPSAAAAALRASAKGAGAVPPMPPLAEWLRGFVPDNPVKAAADGAMVPLVFFALVFGLAGARLEAPRRATLFAFFDAVQAAMMVVVGWVLWVAPVGVAALSLSFGARTGVQGLGVLAQYVAVVSLMCLSAGVLGLLAGMIGGGVRPGALLGALIPVNAVAISTQSSLACLPTLLQAADRVGVRASIRDLVMPMAVALFRITSPAGNMAVAVYVAHIYGLHLDPARLVAGVLVAALVSVAAVGIASAVTFFTTLGPIFMAMGLPMELLPLFLAVETLPDLSRTLGNVAGHLGAAALLDRRSPRAEA